MHSQMTQYVAREQVADRIRRARVHERIARTTHPPPGLRGRAAAVTARLAWWLDADAARLALK